MSCAHGLVAGAETTDTESVFSIDASSVTFGRGALAEVGELVRGLGCRRVALFTDRTLSRLAHVDTVKRALAAAGIDVGIYDAVHVEPTEASFLDAARFAREGSFDGYVSVGGGSVMDTCKAAILYATHPADFLTYVNAPVGRGQTVPGALPPHVACPTTCGTGSELTGIAVCGVTLGDGAHAKTGIASRRLRPTFAVVDPSTTATLPAGVVAASGFDVLCHALESFTARPFLARARPGSPGARPMSQGQNPWSDIGSAEALRLTGRYLVRAVRDATDAEAREQMSWAATLAGIAFGNAGVHLPHGMAYAVAGLARPASEGGFEMPGYPRGEALIPHGVSVVVAAPAALRFTAPASPERHRRAFVHLRGERASAAELDRDPEADPGDALARLLERMMRECGVPVGLGALGYGAADLDALVRGTAVQRRLLDNTPRAVAERELADVFRSALV